MDIDRTQNQCNSCRAAVPSYDGIYVTGEKTTRFLCSKCYNDSMAETMGLKFDHLSFHPITMEDMNGENHTFNFRTHLFGDKVFVQALEIKDSEPKGYVLSVHGNAEEDLFGLLAKLVERIRRALARKHIETGDLVRYEITDENIVRGHIAWDDDTSGELPCLVIDGKELSWHEFGRMLMAYEGFHFKLEIFEASEEK